jgi:hypothetical protein
MSSRSLVTVAVVLASALAFSSQVLAQDAEGQAAVEKRLNAFREIGAANKNIRDELNAPMPDASKITKSAQEIISNAKSSGGIPNWFPGGGGRPPDPKYGRVKIKCYF